MSKIKRINEFYKIPEFDSINKIFTIEKTYTDEVFDCLMDILCSEKGISEKSFKDIDNTRNYLEGFFDNNQEILIEIDEFNSHNERPSYCAEYIYSKYFV